MSRAALRSPIRARGREVRDAHPGENTMPATALSSKPSAVRKRAQRRRQSAERAAIRAELAKRTSWMMEAADVRPVLWLDHGCDRERVMGAMVETFTATLQATGNGARARFEAEMEGERLALSIWSDRQGRCGARAKSTGEPCRALGTGRGGRCRMHGGASTGPRTPEGRARALANLRRA